MLKYITIMSQKIMAHLKTLKASPYAIAAGFACGAAVSVTPFVGFHMVLAVLLSLLIRANAAAALIGTAVGNPWTFALIWPLTYETGRKILGLSEKQHIDFLSFFKQLKQAVLGINLDALAVDLSPVLKPMAIGSIPYFILVWIASFYLIKHILKNMKVYKTS